MTTMVPTAVATCAALGEGGSPSGVSLATLCVGQIELISAIDEYHATQKWA